MASNSPPLKVTIPCKSSIPVSGNTVGTAAVLVTLLVIVAVAQRQLLDVLHSGFLHLSDSVSQINPLEQLSSELHLLLHPTVVGSGVAVGHLQALDVLHSGFLHLPESASQIRPSEQLSSESQRLLQSTTVGSGVVVPVTVTVAEGVAVTVAEGVAVGVAVTVTVTVTVVVTVEVIVDVGGVVGVFVLSTTFPPEPIHPTPCWQDVPDAQ